MLLNTFTYVCFLAVTACIHWMLPTRFRNGFLVAVSVAFLYFNGFGSLTVAVLTAAGGYVFGRLIEAQQEPKKRKALLITGIVMLAGSLCFFKYAALWNAFLTRPVSVIFPVGISFYTFESIGYLADVYLGKAKAEKDPVDWALAVLFYPQVLSGPIARIERIMPQVKERTVDEAVIGEGLRRFLSGSMCKIALADGLAILVDGIYGNMDAHSGLAITAAAFLYPIQLYFDFSGYSSMAIGSGLLFGIRLQENFLAPYFSTGMGEIWRRWHITLSEWFRDYIYFPLGGSRKGEHRTLINLLTVFTVSALWHGNSWSNLVWGTVIVVSRFLERIFSKNTELGDPHSLRNWLKRAGVYVWWTMTLVPFRMETVPDIFKMLGRQLEIPNLRGFMGEILNLAANQISATGTYYLIYFGSLIVGFAIECWKDYRLYFSCTEKGSVPETDPLASLPRNRRWLLYWIMGLITAAMYILTQTGGGPSFIYQGY